MDCSTYLALLSLAEDRKFCFWIWAQALVFFFWGGGYFDKRSLLEN